MVVIFVRFVNGELLELDVENGEKKELLRMILRVLV